MEHVPDDPSVPLPGLPVPDSAIPQLMAVAAGAARRNGGGSPEWASAVVTTHERALTSATPGHRVPGREEVVVYLVTMKGISRPGRPVRSAAGIRPALTCRW